MQSDKKQILNRLASIEGHLILQEEDYPVESVG
jgi:hypothetical protein